MCSGFLSPIINNSNNLFSTSLAFSILLAWTSARVSPISTLLSTFLFNTKVVNFEKENDRITSIIYKDINNEEIKMKADIVVLAIGHSSREMFEILYCRSENWA